MESKYLEVLFLSTSIANRKLLYGIAAIGLYTALQGVYNILICGERKVKIDIKNIARYQETLKKDGMIVETKKQ